MTLTLLATMHPMSLAAAVGTSSHVSITVGTASHVYCCRRQRCKITATGTLLTHRNKGTANLPQQGHSIRLCVSLFDVVPSQLIVALQLGAGCQDTSGSSIMSGSVEFNRCVRLCLANLSTDFAFRCMMHLTREAFRRSRIRQLSAI